jgi:SNF2 family DNA or RNA helicase
VSCLENDAVLKERCFVPGCQTQPRRHNIVLGETLGVEDRKDGVGRHYGMKLEKLVDLIKNKIPKDEKILLFVQFVDLMEKVSEVLGQYGVKHVQISGTAAQKSKILDEFQQNKGERVLLMNVMTESAAGS